MTRGSMMTGMPLGTVIVLFLTSVLPPLAAARTPEPEVSMRRLEGLVSSEKRIRLDTGTDRHVLVRPWLSDGTVGSKEDSSTYRLDDVRTMQAYRSYTGRGGGIGLLVGMGLGALLDAYARAALDAGQESSSDATMGLVALGGGVGLVLGLLAGTASSGWKTIYEHPAESN
jgi:hypothetical protein